MTFGATGHRPSKLGNEYDLIGPYSNYIRKEIKYFIELYKPDDFLSGMALGIDMMVALLALEYNKPLTVAIPFKGQESAWPEKSQKLYHEILKHPLVKDRIVYVSDPGYAGWKMQKRNIWMIDYLISKPERKLLSVWDGSEGGTANCMKYAEKKLPIEDILRIDPKNALITV